MVCGGNELITKSTELDASDCQSCHPDHSLLCKGGAGISVYKIRGLQVSGKGDYNDSGHRCSVYTVGIPNLYQTLEPLIQKLKVVVPLLLILNTTHYK